MDWARRIELASVLAASLVALIGLGYTGVQMRLSTDQAREDRALVKEGQITDRYTAAVANLGEDTMEVRLGGIYALERIMQDSSRDQPTIANVLAAYVRAHAAQPPAKGQSVPADIHAALAVLAYRDTAHDENFRLDLRAARLPRAELNLGAALSDAVLSRTDLSRAILTGADLTGTVLSSADLTGANLTRTDLTDANLTGTVLSSANLAEANLLNANLTGANLSGVNLSDAVLNRANLSRANLSQVNLSDAIVLAADLTGADLKGADLTGANLSLVEGLTKKQVDSARTDGRTLLPRLVPAPGREPG